MNSPAVAIIDYGSGNLRSAAKAFAHVMESEELPGDVVITGDPEIIRRAHKIVLPGQGAFGDCMAGLSKIDGMIEALNESVWKRATPFLGICVGMQLMADYGHEFGTHKGLGWISGDVKKLNPSDKTLKIPHMGWNGLLIDAKETHPVLQSIRENAESAALDFYFVHSFVFECKDQSSVAGWCDYGGRFAAVVAKDNMIGMQFHPEKSQQCGMDLIRGFLNWKP